MFGFLPCFLRISFQNCYLFVSHKPQCFFWSKSSWSILTKICKLACFSLTGVQMTIRTELEKAIIFHHSRGSQLISRTQLEKVIIFPHSQGVATDLQDTAWESDHFLPLTGDPTDIQDAAWESDHFSSITGSRNWPPRHSLRKWSFFVTPGGPNWPFRCLDFWLLLTISNHFDHVTTGLN